VPTNIGSSHDAVATAFVGTCILLASRPSMSIWSCRRVGERDTSLGKPLWLCGHINADLGKQFGNQRLWDLFQSPTAANPTIPKKDQSSFSKDNYPQKKTEVKCHNPHFPHAHAMPCRAFPNATRKNPSPHASQKQHPINGVLQTKISDPAIQLYTSLLLGLPCPSPKSYLWLGAGSRAGPPCHGVPCPSMSPLKLLCGVGGGAWKLYGPPQFC